MKTVTIRKSHEFSTDSKVYLRVSGERTHIKGFGPVTFNLEPGKEFFASHQWTSSNRISYDRISDGSLFIIKPRLREIHALLILFLTGLSIILFVITRSKWSFIMPSPLLLYIIVYLTILKNRYLIIKPFTGK